MNAVIFFGIVVMWAVVLIPMWLKRHDEVEETRSVDKFTSAMHTLSRRDAAPEKRYVVMPHRSRSLDVHVSGASADRARSPKRRPGSRPAARPALTPAGRRRRTLLGLLVLTVVTLGAAVLTGGLALWGLQLVVDGALVAFVLHLRQRARGAALVRPARRRAAPVSRPVPRYQPEYDDYDYDEYEDDEAATDAVDLVDDDEVFEPVAVRAAAPAAAAVFDQTAMADEDTSEDDIAVGEAVFDGHAFDDTAFDDAPFDVEAEPVRARIEFEPTPAAAEVVFDQAEAAEAQPRKQVASYQTAGRDFEIDIALSDPAAEPAAAAASEIGSRPWEPVPVPRPIYASKPAAPARSARAPAYEPLLPPVEASAELDPVEDLEEILDRRWAVND